MGLRPRGEWHAGQRWNGRTWSIQPTPSPGNEGIPFAAVSCGWPRPAPWWGTTTSTTLASPRPRWLSTGMAIAGAPSPCRQPGTPAADLTSVSCQRVACTAAGYYLGQSDEGPGTAPLALRWNGTAWAAQPTPGDPTQNQISALNGISCPSARVCTAVGISYSDGPLVLRWNGTTWHSQACGPVTRSTRSRAHPTPRASPSPAPPRTAAPPRNAGMAARGHRGLSPCRRGSTVSACRRGVLLGGPVHSGRIQEHHREPGQRHADLAEHWNGHRWAVQPTPSP